MPPAGRAVTGPDGVPAAWFDDATLVACLPPHLRAYAAYSRLAVNRQTGRVPGGSFLLRVLHRTTPALHLPRDARVLIAGRSVHVDLTDARFLWVLDEVRGLGHEHRVMKALLRPGDTFLDIGANHGSFAILASHLVGRTGLVIAVEPQPRLAGLIRRSLAEAPAPFEVHAVALGERDADAVLHIPRSGSGAASVAAPPQGMSQSITVPLRRADQLLAWRAFPGSLLVKLDIEGGELPFLHGATAMLRERRPAIVLEISPAQAHAAGYQPSDLVAALGALGYQDFAEVDRYPEKVPGRDLKLERQRNVLAMPGPMGVKGA